MKIKTKLSKLKVNFQKKHRKNCESALWAKKGFIERMDFFKQKALLNKDFIERKAFLKKKNWSKLQNLVEIVKCG